MRFAARLMVLLCAFLYGSTILSASEKATTPKERDLRVLLIVSDHCPKCEQELQTLESAGGVFESLRLSGWKIGPAADSHVQIVKDSEIPQLIQSVKPLTMPCVLCVQKDKVLRSFHDGCTTPLDAYTFGWLLKGVSERPQAPPTLEATVVTSGNYPLRGNHWSLEDYTRPSRTRTLGHLRGGNHVSLFPQSWQIESWSYEELLSLHDDLHENNRPRELLRPATVQATAR